MKAFDLVIVKHDGFEHLGQVVSLPTPEKTIMVRMVPGNPTSMKELPVERIVESRITKKYKYVQYAQVGGNGSFPVDMLRYDFATPVNFTLAEDETGHVFAELDDDSGDALIIARCTHLKSGGQGGPWTAGRWNSFGWSVQSISDPMKIEDHPSI